MSSDVERRLAEIEGRLERFKWALRFEEARPGSITVQIFGEDVPWLIEQVRRRDRVRVVS